MTNTTTGTANGKRQSSPATCDILSGVGEGWVRVSCGREFRPGGGCSEAVDFGVSSIFSCSLSPVLTTEEAALALVLASAAEEAKTPAGERVTRYLPSSSSCAFSCSTSVASSSPSRSCPLPHLAEVVGLQLESFSSFSANG